MSPETTSKGRVARVIGPVVDIEFPADSMPAIFNALHVDVTMGEQTRTLTMEYAVEWSRLIELQMEGSIG